MSEEINVLREDIRVTVSVAPEFPKERLLPLEPSVLSKNISRQVEEERKYNEEKIKRDREGGGESSGIPCCKTLHVSIGYDGTNNNDRADGASLPPSKVMWQSYFMLLSEKVPCRKGWVSFDITALGLVRYFQIFGNILRRVSV